MSTLATWFTPSLQTISRSSGRSAVAAAAYRACTEIYDFRTGITHDFTPKAFRGLACNVLVGVPNNDIKKLWNDAERAETRANSTVARELMLPLPYEWDDEQNRKCVLDIATMLNTTYGVAVQASIHRPTRSDKNKHGHILFTTRTVNANGEFGKKTRILDDLKTGEVKRMREAVAAIVNLHAIKNNADWFVTAGKYAEHIQNHIPTHHISINHGKQQKKFIDLNRADVAEARNELSKLQRQIDSIDQKIKALDTTQETQAKHQETKSNLDEADGKTIKANEHRLKEVALQMQAWKEQLDSWEKANKDYVGGMAKRIESKKQHVKDYGLEDYENEIDGFKQLIEQCGENIYVLKLNLKDPVSKMLAAEYWKREPVMDKAKRIEKECKIELLDIAGRISKGELLGLWEPESQLTCEEKRDELISTLNEAQQFIWDKTPEDERNTIMEPPPAKAYTNEQLGALQKTPFESLQDVSDRIESTRLKRNAMVAERGIFINEEWHI